MGYLEISTADEETARPYFGKLGDPTGRAGGDIPVTSRAAFLSWELGDPTRGEDEACPGSHDSPGDPPSQPEALTVSLSIRGCTVGCSGRKEGQKLRVPWRGRTRAFGAPVVCDEGFPC